MEPESNNWSLKRRFNLLAGLCALLVLPACMAPPVALLVGQPVVTGRPVSMDNLLVVVTNTAGMWAAENQTLADAIASGLRQTEMFASVVETQTDLGDGDGVKLMVEITALKPVTDNARDWTGPLAGRARIAVRVMVADLKSRRTIETFAVAGESGQSAYAGTTDEAIQMAAQQIVAEMLRLNVQVEQ